MRGRQPGGGLVRAKKWEGKKMGGQKNGRAKIFEGKKIGDLESGEAQGNLESRLV